jgi:hypothetical protein
MAISSRSGSFPPVGGDAGPCVFSVVLSTFMSAAQQRCDMAISSRLGSSRGVCLCVFSVVLSQKNTSVVLPRAIRLSRRNIYVSTTWASAPAPVRPHVALRGRLRAVWDISARGVPAPVPNRLFYLLIFLLISPWRAHQQKIIPAPSPKTSTNLITNAIPKTIQSSVSAVFFFSPLFRHSIARSPAILVIPFSARARWVFPS